MADDQTIGELGRRLDTGFADLKEDLRALTARLDGKVDVQLLRLEQQAQDERHKALAEQVAGMRLKADAEEKRLQDTRRWIIGVIVVPLIAVILPLLLTRGKLL